MNTAGRALVAAVLIGVALLVSAVLRRRRPDAPTQARRALPTQLDRRDFARPDTPWLVVIFSSATCSACALVIDKANVLASDDVAVHDAAFPDQRALHDRYGVDAVPTLLVADAMGVVRAAFQGPVTATDLWAAVAEARAPGTTPEPHLGT